MLYATQLRIGMIVNFENALFRVIHVLHVTPGNKRGFVQAKMKNLADGTQRVCKFRSEDKIERAFLDQKEMEYIYNDGSHYYFMDTKTYEQIPFEESLLEEEIFYLLPNIKLLVNMYEGKPVGIELPSTVNLRVVKTEPMLKGATQSGSFKPATLETNLKIQVPQFVEIGNVVKVNTSDGKYLERVQN